MYVYDEQDEKRGGNLINTREVEKTFMEGLYEERSEASFRLRFVTMVARMIPDKQPLRKASYSLLKALLSQ